MVGLEGFQSVEQLLFPRLMPLSGMLLPLIPPTQKQWQLQHGRMTQYRDPSGSLLNLLPEFQIPDSPQATLIWTSLSPREPRVSDCEWNFVHWLFNRMPVSPADSVFQARSYVECIFLALVFWAGDTSLGFRLHISQREPPTAEISL